MKTEKPFFLSLILVFLTAFFHPVAAGNASFALANLQVEYASTPIGVDVQSPGFSWQMTAEGSVRGSSQKSFRLEVRNPSGKIVWDSGLRKQEQSLNIQYEGEQLKPNTRYDWVVTVSNQQGKSVQAASWFETGMMNPSASAWGNAKWIGGDANQLPFYSPYLEVFKLSYTFQMDKNTATKKSAFIFGANDSRLLDNNKNILRVESPKDGTYVKLEFDFSKVNASSDSTALLHIYRVGYHPSDKADVPFRTFKLPASLINPGNIYAPHSVAFESVAGLLALTVDGQKYSLPKDPSPSPFLQPAINLNPMGWGGDFICFPMLAEIGFAVEAGKKASFSDLKISNYREPSNTLFAEDLSAPDSYSGAFASFLDKGLSIRNNAYAVDGGKSGSFVVADPSRNAQPMLRTVFEVASKKVAKARLYITSRGIYEAYINGKRIGNDYFNPGLTQYDKTQLYQAYDVTGDVQAGKNAVGVMLGEGWWSGNITFIPSKWNYFGDRQSLLTKLVVTYEDGTVTVVDSDPRQWRFFSDGPVRCGSLFQGEVYDARKEQAIAGWSTPAYDDSRWSKTVEVPTVGTTYRKGDQVMMGGMKIMEINPLNDYDKTNLLGNTGENVRVVKELKAVAVQEVRPGVYVYDLGQNIVGFPRIHVSGKSGQCVTIRFAEMKYPDLPEYSLNKGMILTENLRAALCQDKYYMKGGGEEVIQPRFTSHGFRYIEITGIERPLPLDAVAGLAISSVHELASSYESSNADVNKLWTNIIWSMRDNFVSIPTDCPQRNERMGWSGDISVFSRTATYMATMPQFLRRHLLAMRDGQNDQGRFNDVAPIGGGFGGILWGSAGITVPWEAFQQYDDKAMLAEHYEAMKHYIDYLGKNTSPQDGRFVGALLGDWLSPEGSTFGPNGVNCLIWDAYYIYDLDLMTKIATVLGQASDARQFEQLAAKRRELFQQTYVDSKRGNLINPDTKQAFHMQAPYAISLALNAVGEEVKPLAAKRLDDILKQENKDDKGVANPPYSLMTGFIGTTWITKALSDNGANETAYRLLQQTSYPSWLYSVKQGATTIWERLNSYTVENGFGGNNSMNSFNHYSFGAIGAWLYAYSLGIQRDENAPGFKHFILQPTPDPDRVMTYARGHYDSMYGRIESAWQWKGTKLVYDATVPANTSATLFLPARNADAITEGGKRAKTQKGIRLMKYENGKACFELAAGSYHFELE